MKERQSLILSGGVNDNHPNTLISKIDEVTQSRENRSQSRSRIASAHDIPSIQAQ